MANEKIYPKGVRVFAPHEKAPKWVKGTVLITLDDLVQFAKDNPLLLTEYAGKQQLRLQLQEGQNGLTMVVDTYKKEASQKQDDVLPF